MSKGCIYAITNIINNKIYVGQTRDIERRFRHHKLYLKNGKHPNEQLQEDYNEYGEDCFEYTILCECDLKLLDEMEEYYIRKLMSHDKNTGYNKTYGGKGSCKTSEVKEKISNSHKGKRLSEDTKRKVRENHADFSGEKHPKFKGFVCVFPNGDVSSVMTQKEMKSYLGISQPLVEKLSKTKEPYIPSKHHPNKKHLEGIRILYYKDYINMVGDINE